MANPLPNTTTTANFRDVVLATGGPCGSGSILIANNPVQMLVESGGEQGVTHSTLYPYLAPSIVPLAAGKEDFIWSVAFADFTPGTHAQVSGWLVPLNLAGPAGGNPFTQTIAPSGAISAVGVVYRQTGQVGVTGTTETDLLGGAFTIAANQLTAGSLLRLTLWGDWAPTTNNAAPPRFRVKLGTGPTTIIDTNTTVGQIGASSTRSGWRTIVEVMNLTIASQWTNYKTKLSSPGPVVAGEGTFVTGEGRVSQGSVSGGAYAFTDYEGGNSSAVNFANAQLVQVTVALQSAPHDLQCKGAIAEIL